MTEESKTGIVRRMLTKATPSEAALGEVRRVWRQAADLAGQIQAAAVELQRVEAQAAEAVGSPAFETTLREVPMAQARLAALRAAHSKCEAKIRPAVMRVIDERRLELLKESDELRDAAFETHRRVLRHLAEIAKLLGVETGIPLGILFCGQYQVHCDPAALDPRLLPVDLFTMAPRTLDLLSRADNLRSRADQLETFEDSREREFEQILGALKNGQEAAA